MRRGILAQAKATEGKSADLKEDHFGLSTGTFSHFRLLSLKTLSHSLLFPLLYVQKETVCNTSMFPGLEVIALSVNKDRCSYVKSNTGF